MIIECFYYGDHLTDECPFKLEPCGFPTYTLQMTFDQKTIREIIFSWERPFSKLYDLLLIVAVSLSVLVVMLDSVASIRASYSMRLNVFEWVFTVLFTIDYGLRLYSAKKRTGYALSFFGIVDLLSVVPTYLSLFVPGSEYLATLRFLRIMRIFRVLKLSTYQDELNHMLIAVKASWRRIAVFLCLVLTIVVVLGSFMYTIEGAKNGFTSIPKSIYWAIVTMTTVGYGDISPQTGVGQTIAALIMILGYSIIVVPTGIMVSASHSKTSHTRSCPKCNTDDHSADSTFCRHCGEKMS